MTSGTAERVNDLIEKIMTLQAEIDAAMDPVIVADLKYKLKSARDALNAEKVSRLYKLLRGIR